MPIGENRRGVDAVPLRVFLDLHHDLPEDTAGTEIVDLASRRTIEVSEYAAIDAARIDAAE